MRTVRLAISIVAAAALVPLTASAAFAAPPGNDKPGGAIELSLGDTVKEDTSQATTDKTDSEANQVCGAPFTNASVWFTYTPSADGTFLLDMSKSDYTGGFMVFEGQPSSRTLISCGPTSVAVSGTAGTLYYISAFSDTEVNGGNLVLALKKGPPAPTLKITVDPVGKAFPNGNARIFGTFSCKNSDFLDIEGKLVQIWKRVKITGYISKFYGGNVCDGQEHSWTKVVESDNGIYEGGDATVYLDSFACGQIDCTEFEATQQVSLTQMGNPPAGPRITAKSHDSAHSTPWWSRPGMSKWQSASAIAAHLGR